MIPVGTQKLSADGVVGTSGKPIMLYSVHIASKAGGAGTVTLYDGTSTGDTAYSTHEGEADAGIEINFGPH